MPTTEFPIAQDAHIASDAPSTNYGGSGTLTLSRSTSKGTEARVLFDADLSSIPVGATVVDATLALSYESSTGLANVIIDRLTRAWVEAQATWSDASTGIAWTTAGGDYSTPQVSGADFGVDIGSPVSISVDVATLVEDAIANRGGLFSIIIRPSVLEADGSVSIASRENATPSRRPLLSVSYIEPGGGGGARNRSRSRARGSDWSVYA